MPGFGVFVDLGAAPRVFASLIRLEGAKRGLQLAGQHIVTEADDYPASRRITRKAAFGEVFQNLDQQKALFAKKDAGEITVPYARREKGGIAGGWYVRQSSDGLETEVGNRAPGAEWVLDRTRQSRMMAMIGWRTLQEIIARESANVQRIVREEILRSIE